MFLQNRLRMIAVAAGVGLLLSACGSAQSLDPADDEGIAQLSLGTYPNSSLSLPIAVAEKEGIFDGVKLDVTTVSGKSGPEITSALIGGTTQIAPSTPESTFSALRDGQNLVVIQPVAALNYMILAPAEVAGNGIGGLKGKRIGVPARGSAAEAFARALLSGDGLNPDADVTFMAVGGSATLVPAYTQGQIDASVGTPSTAAALRSQGLDATVMADAADGGAGELGEYGFGGFFTTTTDVVEKSPIVLHRFCEAMRSSTAYIADPANRDSVITTLSEVMKLPEASVAPIYDAERTLWTNDITEERWNKNAEWVLGSDAAKAPFGTSTNSCS
ncbi:ABC transporter substrate-binding protein [Rhodococcus erythropolis]|uniref:ABC transporter substrate-binding protein n=1 Tax=Rhodococcus erythropolis TaxID=1833 RepID=UPI0040422275